MTQEEVYYGFDEKTGQPLISVGDDDAAWVLSGEKLEKLFNMTNFDRDEAVMKFARPTVAWGWWSSPCAWGKRWRYRPDQ